MTSAIASSRGSAHGSPEAPRVPRPRLLLAAALVFGLACSGDYSGGSSSSSESAQSQSGSGGTSQNATGGSSFDRDESLAAFGTTVFPIVRDHCADCHAGAGPGFPSIAHADNATAHDAVLDNQKVSFTAPDNSRLVQRLVTDFHYCWDDCSANGAEMQAAVEAWVAALGFVGGGGTTTVVTEGITSGTLTLADGIEDEGQDRYMQNLVAFYDFKEGSGSVARDKSGVEPAMDLELDDVEWMSSYGVSFDGDEDEMAIASRDASRKLFDRIASPQTGTQQYSVEAWVVPANTAQEGPARILGYSRGTGRRNFTLGQVLYNYDFRNRSMAPDVNDNGSPALQTYDADQDLQDTLQHVVMTYDQFRGRRIYVNGVWTDDVDDQGPGRLWTWDSSHQFVLGNETSGNRPWEGKIQLVAVYDHALTEAQIQQNFDAGVGKRLLMRFDVSQWAGAGAYVEAVISEFDEYSYLVCEPRLIGNVSGVRVKNLRILVNGQMPVAGQSFVHLDEAVLASNQLLSRQCSVIAKDAGPETDAFTLEFEVIGSFENPIVVENPPVPPPSFDSAAPVPEQGLRDYARVNASMAAVTGVDANTETVRETFLDLEQQLPSGHDLRTFTSSQQVGISKLALEYCNELVETPALRDAFFGSFEFDAPVSTAFSSQAKRDQIIDALVARSLGSNLAAQPSYAEVHPVLDQLITDLTAGCAGGTCSAERTRAVVKGVCAAVLASAGVSVH